MTTDALAIATPKSVAGMPGVISSHSDNLRDRQEPPLRSSHTTDNTQDCARVEQMLQTVRATGRTRLITNELEQLLATYGIVAMGIQSATNLDPRGDDSIVAVEYALAATQQDATIDEGYELIIGSHVDRQCGSVLSLRADRPLRGVFLNRALALPPLTTGMARRMVERTGITAMLTETDDRTRRSLETLDQLLICVSQLIAEQRWIKQLLLRLLVIPQVGLPVLDAQVVLYDAVVQADDLPALSIRPYPVQYVTEWMLRDGTPVTIRPIRPEDEPLMVRFHETLSEQTVELRYFGPQKLSQRVAPEQLLRIRCVDYDREMVLLVEQRDPITGERAILGLGCLIKLHRSNDAEVALLVGDAWQVQGIGSELLRRLIKIGHDKGVARIIGEVLPDNQVMLRILPRFGFQLHRSMTEPVQVVLVL
jgi:acetyltransferase